MTLLVNRVKMQRGPGHCVRKPHREVFVFTGHEAPESSMGMEPCARCRAKGIIVCPVCQGTREIRNTSYVVIGQCQNCREARGFITCPNCLGKKVVDTDRLREMRKLESEGLQGNPAVWGFTIPTPPRRISGEAVAKTEAFEREYREVIAKTTAPEREAGELVSLITRDGAKKDEILRSGVPHEISQVQAVDAPAVSMGLEQVGESPADKSRSSAAARSSEPESYSRNEWREAGIGNLVFRRADLGHLEEAIQLIYSAGPREADYAFAVGGQKALDFLRIAFVHGSNLLGHRSQIVAVEDGQVVGIGAFHDGAKFGMANRKMLYPIAEFYNPLTGAGVITRLTQLQKQLWPPPGRRDLFIQNLGVREDMRGKGVGTGLLSYLIEMARSKGFRRCIIDVAVSNPRAQTLYERLGFRVVEERKWHITGSTAHVPDSRRMELLL